MSPIGIFEYEITAIEHELLARIAERVEQGKSLLRSDIHHASEGDFTAWIGSFSGVIDTIDPLGEDYSGSLSARWHDARWYGGNPPKYYPEWRAVFGQYLGIARSLLDGQAKVVARKLDEQSVATNCVFHRRQLSPQDNMVFVLMPFVEDWSDYIWRNEIKPAVERIDTLPLICKRADDLFGHDVMLDIYESIATARIVIAEITNRNANVFYELGMAHALGKDVILLSQGTAHIPFDLNRFRHCIYSNDGPGYEKLRSYLPHAINEALNSSGGTVLDSG